MLSSWDQRFEISCSELVFSSTFSDCRRSTFHKDLASVQIKIKHLHCNFFAINTTCMVPLASTLFLSAPGLENAPVALAEPPCDMQPTPQLHLKSKGWEFREFQTCWLFASVWNRLQLLQCCTFFLGLVQNAFGLQGFHHNWNTPKFSIEPSLVIQVISNHLLWCVRKCLNQTKGERPLGSETNIPNKPVANTHKNWTSKLYHCQYGLVHTIV